MTKYEYKVAFFRIYASNYGLTNCDQARLDDLAAVGWEPILSNIEHSKVIYTFRRELR